MLWEQFREIARTDDTTKREKDYRIKLSEAEQLAEMLRKLLREPVDKSALDVAFKQASQNCVACHKSYRNE